MWRSHVFCCSFICVLALANSHENKQQPMNAQDISYKRTKLCEGLFVCGCRCMLCCAVWFVHGLLCAFAFAVEFSASV
ncbi:transmembrane protein, putative [Medicago truncatula]|uniref:Transmembrane protein, putative n=1 Tax=Medicago truncatula TaxID=3880 RepID=A0A072TK44_MEDTR|nr:transmembrane protein, putative [Medicago truncatula]